MNGIIVVNKPAGLSSNTVVGIVKKAVGAKKAGHLGTLDVLGDGVLPVTIGKATRLFDFFLSKSKTYVATFVFGFETETLDAEGRIVKTCERGVELDDIQDALCKFVGKQLQLPPQFSSKKIGGKSAYLLARKGEEVLLKEKEIEIFSFKFLGEAREEERKILLERFSKFHSDDELKKLNLLPIYKFEISCSAGTYIRSLCRDFAQHLGTCGTMLSITRTRCGVFDLSGASSLEDVKNGNYVLVKPEEAVDLPSIEISSEQKRDLLNGKIVTIEKPSGQFKLFCGGDFLGIVEVNNFKLKIKTFLLEEENEQG